MTPRAVPGQPLRVLVTGAPLDPASWTYVANGQCRRDECGHPALLEVNPRVPGTLGLTIASGVDMPRLAIDSLLGRPVPRQMTFRELAVVRFLDERFIDPADIMATRMVMT